MSSPSNHGSQAYLKTKVMTASPAELRLMLIDGAIRFTEQARRGYETRNFEMAFEGSSRAQAIVIELMNALRPDQAPELCERLSALYTYIYQCLVQAAAMRDLAQYDEALKRLRFERETWVLCMDELAKENQSASAMRAIPTAASPAGSNGSAAPRSGLSMQG